MYIYVSLLIAIVGAAAYALSGNSKIAELGRIAYFAGLLAFLFQLGSKAVSLGH